MRARTLGIVAAAGLAALVGGCTCTSKNETHDGYRLCEKSFPSAESVCFEHNRLLNRDALYVNGDTLALYRDNGCDGTIDIFCAIDCYSRGESGTEELFARADKEFTQYKKELGVQ